MVAAARGDNAAPTVAEIQAAGQQAEVVSLEATDTASIDAMIAGVLERHSRIDILVNNVGITRDQLLNLTQGRDSDIFDRSIDLLVSRLRQRLGDEAREPRYIKTVRNEGYVFCAEVLPAGAAP